ncbi:hypothetical protein ACFPK1_03780 [Actinomycetospora rhizophila]|uniref:Luciferase-like monooxygenase n=1 Tax=Actinomycetospora rhizophila TaxID=1416876 RepID=A0ABV9Z6Z6_9PSEU
MTLAPPRVVVLDPVDHGLVTPAGGSRDLDALLDRARAAETDGGAVVVVPSGAPDAPARHHWPATAQALAVLLATTSVQVAVGVVPAAWEPDAIARFARSATGLAGDRLIVQVRGASAEAFAGALTARWDGPVVVGDGDLGAHA